MVKRRKQMARKRPPELVQEVTPADIPVLTQPVFTSGRNGAAPVLTETLVEFADPVPVLEDAASPA